MENLSDNRRANISKGQKRRYTNPLMREQTAEGTREAFKNPEIRKKYCIQVRCIETGKVYASGVDAEKETGISRSSICACCKGKREDAGGFH